MFQVIHINNVIDISGICSSPFNPELDFLARWGWLLVNFFHQNLFMPPGLGVPRGYRLKQYFKLHLLKTSAKTIKLRPCSSFSVEFNPMSGWWNISNKRYFLGSVCTLRNLSPISLDTFTVIILYSFLVDSSEMVQLPEEQELSYPSSTLSIEMAWRYLQRQQLQISDGKYCLLFQFFWVVPLHFWVKRLLTTQLEVKFQLFSYARVS